MKELKQIFFHKIEIQQNHIISKIDQLDKNQNQTKDIFSEKWKEVEVMENVKIGIQKQFEWFKALYGFETENALKVFLSHKKIILDAGCGMGYKSAWLAQLAPESNVIGMDISNVIESNVNYYKHIPNLFFIQGDIAHTGIKNQTIDFVLCDQVIHHTENPEKTFKHLSELLTEKGEFACYVYAKKALPRELLDEFFRTQTHQISSEDMWAFSSQLTELGKRLSELNIQFDCPDIPLLGIKGGQYDIQRFIYWNFLKCFWDADRGFELSKSVNFDWYAPSNAQRYSKEEFESMIFQNRLKIEYFHSEEACYSGRFSKQGQA